MNVISGKYGSWWLVAGAAEGIGEAFCRSLAYRKINKVMVDHNEAAMAALAGVHEKEYTISTMRKMYGDKMD